MYFVFSALHQRLHSLTMTVEELETLHKQTFETNNANEEALKQFSAELEKLQAEVEGNLFKFIQKMSDFLYSKILIFSPSVFQLLSAMPVSALDW